MNGESVNAKYECECRYCGTVFFSDTKGDDCGGCRLNDEQCTDYLKQRAKDGAP